MPSSDRHQNKISAQTLGHTLTLVKKQMFKVCILWAGTRRVRFSEVKINLGQVIGHVRAAFRKANQFETKFLSNPTVSGQIKTS